MVQGVWSEDPAAQIEATTQFRKLLSIGMNVVVLLKIFLEYFNKPVLSVDFWFAMCVERSPPIDEVIKAGVVPRFVEFLGRQDLPQLQVGTILFFLVLLSCYFLCLKSI